VIGSVDFRYEGRRIEMGLFTESGDCVDVRRLTRPEAITLRDALNAALADQESARPGRFLRMSRRSNRSKP
jgi:hypothetical protein